MIAVSLCAYGVQLLTLARRRRLDVVYRYYHDTDTLSIYFCKASPGVIATTEDIAPGVTVDYTSEGQVVSVDLSSVSKASSCLFHAAEGKAQLAIHWDYEENKDYLSLYLHAKPDVTNLLQTDDPNMTLGVDSKGLWHAIFFKNASKSVCRAQVMRLQCMDKLCQHL